jgi:hypothetical protein
LAMIFDSYCFIMLKKYSNPIDGIVKEPWSVLKRQPTNEDN